MKTLLSSIFIDEEYYFGTCRVDTTKVYIVTQESCRTSSTKCIWLHGWGWKRSMERFMDFFWTAVIRYLHQAHFIFVHCRNKILRNLLLLQTSILLDLQLPSLLEMKLNESSRNGKNKHSLHLQVIFSIHTLRIISLFKDIVSIPIFQIY